MIDAIADNYKILLNDYNEQNNYISFKYKGDDYFFVPFIRNISEVDLLLRIDKELNQNHFRCHEIILNRFGKALSTIDGKNYILLKINEDYRREVDLFEIVDNSLKYKVTSSNIKKNSNWSKLWQRKVDYLEKQIEALGHNKKELVGSFSYYVGLSENAIAYYNKVYEDNLNDYYTLSHRRIFYPNYWLNYANPLSFVFDIPQRDYAEYLKHEFFFGTKNVYEDFEQLLKIKKMSKNSYQILLARLLFPTYFFDLCEKILLDNADESILINVLDKVGDYEKFLKYCFCRINSIVPVSMLPKWLL